MQKPLIQKLIVRNKFNKFYTKISNNMLMMIIILKLKIKKDQISNKSSSNNTRQSRNNLNTLKVNKSNVYSQTKSSSNSR